MQHQPDKAKEDNDSSPEDPLVLHGPALHHTDRIATDSEGVGNAIEFALRVFQHVLLRAQTAQHFSAALNVFIQLGIILLEEGVFAQRMGLARRRLGPAAKREPACCPGPWRRSKCRSLRIDVLRVRVLGRLRGMGPAAKQLASVLCRQPLVPVPLQVGVALPVVAQLAAESLDALIGLFGFGRVELLLGCVGVVVNRAREGCQSRGYLACADLARLHYQTGSQRHSRAPTL